MADAAAAAAAPVTMEELEKRVEEARAEVAAGSTKEKQLALGAALYALGREHSLRGDHKKALPSLQAAAKAQRKAMAKRMFKDVVLAETLEAEGTARRETGDGAGSLKVLTEALKVRTEAQGDEHADVAGTLNMLAVLHYGQGRADQALATYKRALEIRRKAIGERHESVAGVMMNIANVMGEQGRFDESLEYYEKALDIQKTAVGAESSDVAQTLSNIARVYFSQGKHDEAVAQLREALRVQKVATGERSHGVATMTNNLAAVMREMERHDEAADYCDETLAIYNELLGSEENPHSATAIFNKGLSRFQQERLHEAQALWKRALELYTKTVGPEHGRTKTTASMLRRLDVFVEIADEKAEEARKAKAFEEADKDGDSAEAA